MTTFVPSMATDSQRETCRRIEWVLLFALVALKLHVLVLRWGRLEGFDAAAWLDVFRLTHWFEPLPSPRALFASYHPPLSYLMARLVYAIYPHEIEATQILSTCAILGGVFALRSALRTVGCLWTVSGMWLLYGGASVPLMVWVAMETGYDGLVFLWFMVALALSVRLFWHARSGPWWRDPATVVRLTLLGLVLGAGLLNKFSGCPAFVLPFLVIAVRRGPRALLKEMRAPVLAAIIGAMVAAPLYYQRYYAAEGQLLPASMEWQRGDELRVLRAARNAAPLRFLGHLLRIPPEPIVGTQTPVYDSFNHILWLHTWKRDVGLGGQSPLSLAVSDFYVRAFALVLLLGTVAFLLLRRRIDEPWRHVGWIVLGIFVLFWLSAVAFAWKYPIWNWRVLKAKYMTPAVFWIAYTVGVVLGAAWLPAGNSWWRSSLPRASLVALLTFVFVNHLLPVY